MSLKIDDLDYGDRVVLFCPQCKVGSRHAIFEGFVSKELLEQAAKVRQMHFQDCNLEPDTQYAMFLVQTEVRPPGKDLQLNDGSPIIKLPDAVGEVTLRLLLKVDPAGYLVDGENRRTYIKERTVMGQG